MELWEEHLKDPIALAKALECLENPYLGAFCRRNGFQHRWCKGFAKDVALPEPVGCCASAHIIKLLERPEEVRAARRALFLPHQEGSFALTELVQFKLRGTATHSVTTHSV